MGISISHKFNIIRLKVRGFTSIKIAHFQAVICSKRTKTCQLFLKQPTYLLKAMQKLCYISFESIQYL